MSLFVDFARSLSPVAKAEPVGNASWQKERDDRVHFNLAQQYVLAVERANRTAMDATGWQLESGKSHDHKLRYALDIIYRRVKADGRSDADVGGGYRTMSAEEYKASDGPRLAALHYNSLMKSRGIRNAVFS